ncbi:MAG: hypothetical protein ABL890_04825 [Candidatus Peribacteraceae bacterium]
MTVILLSIGSAAFFSVTSLLVILFRVSPLTAPSVGIPLFFITLLLSIATTMTLSAYGVWHILSIEGMDEGKKLTVALREGIFMAVATGLVCAFQILGILNWWIALLLYAVFLLVEAALHS